jgi:hypothetical protein
LHQFVARQFLAVDVVSEQFSEFWQGVSVHSDGMIPQ